MTTKVNVVAIDGPAASGKSSVAKAVAKALGWQYVTTGAFYRALAVLVEERGIDLDESLLSPGGEAGAQLKTAVSELSWDHESQNVRVCGKDLGAKLFEDSLRPTLARVAAHPLIRELLIGPQRDVALSCKNGAVLDGRDIGSVIFPDAKVKLFLTASSLERAKRRLGQQRGVGATAISGSDEELSAMAKAIEQRDSGDENRAVAPLRCVEDAWRLDTSDLAYDQVVDQVYDHCLRSLSAVEL